MESILIDLPVREYFKFLEYLKNQNSYPLNKDIELYLMGLEKRIPKDWVFILEDFKNMLDPEYAEYLRLKNKFE